MSLRFLTADWIYPVSSPRIREGVVIMDGDRVVDVTSRDKLPSTDLEYFHGIIVPGFVNTHCHLELSHLKGKIDSGTGLLPFIYQIVKFRDIDQEEIEDAIAQADAYMWEQGIQAVGDICNKADTFKTKANSRIHYYSCVEMFDFLQPSPDAFISGNKEVFQLASGNKSAVPHAPYSVSPGLFHEINRLNIDEVTVSIHNQETQAEDDLFRKGTGAFVDFYKSFGLALDHFQHTGQSSIAYAIMHMDPQQRSLFVHNTLTAKEDIATAHEWSQSVFWATCPNANLYIENQLPNYRSFIDHSAKMTIGTDSLSSNWQLSILEEMKTLAKYQSFIPLDLLLQWATLNGAEALGMGSQLGSIEKGKRPGVLVLTMDPEKNKLTDPSVRVNRII